MDFEWTEQERDMAKAVSSALDEAGRDGHDALETAELPRIEEILRGALRALGAAGYLGLALDEGRRAEVLTLMAGQLELAQASGSLYLAVESSARLCGALAAALEDDEAKEAIAGSLGSGASIGAVALAEPSEPEDGRPSVGAKREGDRWVLSGRKSFVTNGPIADWIAVSADADGKTLVAFVQPSGEGVCPGERLRTMGYDGLAVGALDLDAAPVHPSHVVGPFDGAGPMGRMRQLEGLLLTMASVGLMSRTFDAAKAHSRGQRRKGRPIFKWQEVSFKLSEMLTLKQTAELMAYRTGWLYGTADPEAPTVIGCAKVFSSEQAETVASTAMQILAGQGYLFGNPVERSYREARYAALAGTTNELCRLAIADALLERHG